MPRQLKPSELKSVCQQILAKQGNVCAICGKPMTARDYAVLDHDHDTGLIRGVLHNSCNGIEGRAKALAHRSHAGVKSADYLIGLGKYLEHHSKPRIQALHPSHKTERQKKDIRNARARKARAAKRASTKH